jgi:hypothetical protein
LPGICPESAFDIIFFYDIYGFKPRVVKAKITGILLLLCLIAPIASTFTWLQCKKVLVRKAVKRQIMAGIDKNELVLLKFTRKESQTKLRWEHAREFEYKEEMYDIVKTETRGDTIYYWCWWDRVETALNIQLRNLVIIALNNDPQNKENQLRLSNFLKSLYPSPLFWQLLYGKFRTEQIFTYRFSYLSVDLPVPAPPP